MTSLVSYGFLAPPAIFITLGLIGTLLALLWRRVGIALALASMLCLFVAAMPAVSSSLLYPVEAGLPPAGELGKAATLLMPPPAVPPAAPRAVPAPPRPPP